MSAMIERVAKAVDSVQLFSRFNDWTSDRVAGCPVEICRYGQGDEDEIVVVARFGGAITEAEALAGCLAEARARAAIEAMREPTEAMLDADRTAGEHFARRRRPS